MAKSTEQYMVEHDAVGAHRKGSLITATDVAAGDVPRLLGLGAIRRASQEDIEAATAHPVDNTDLALARNIGGGGGATDPTRDPRLATGQPGGAPPPGMGEGEGDAKKEPT